MRSAAELQRLGWRALVKELGLVDAIRYRVLFESGRGEYGRERAELFAGVTLEAWLRELAEWEKGRPRGGAEEKGGEQAAGSPSSD